MTLKSAKAKKLQSHFDTGPGTRAKPACNQISSEAKLGKISKKSKENELPQVLIIDDEHTTLKLFEIILKDTGLQLTLVSDVEAAISALGATPFSIVICDVNLGEPGGLTLLPIVKNLKHRCEIIYLSGQFSPTISAKVLELGAFDFLVKAEDPDVMKAVLINAIGRALQSMAIQT